MSDLEHKVIEIIADYVGVDSDDLTPDMSLREDINIPEIEIADLFTKLEEEFNIEIEPQDQKELKTINDVIAYISDHYEETL